jgi:hypothetical protein
LADQVQHHIDIARHPGEVRGVVDDHVCAQTFDEGPLCLASRDRDMRTMIFGYLYGDMSDPSASTVNEHELGCRQSSTIDQRLPSCETNQRQRGRASVIDTAGLERQLARRRHDKAGVGRGSARRQRHAVHLVAGLKSIDPWHDFLDHAGDIPAQHERRRAEQRKRSRAHHRLESVRPDRLDTNQHLGQRWPGLFEIDLLEHFRTAEHILGNRSHRSPTFVLAPRQGSSSVTNGKSRPGAVTNAGRSTDSRSRLDSASTPRWRDECLTTQ